MKESIFDETIADMTWTELQEKGRKEIPVLFPLGVIEEHGPHLPLGTDIYFSYAICKKIKQSIELKGRECLIAPPYYWGVNHCTGHFPGSFSLRPETMKMVLHDIFGNLKQFGFEKILCVNEHGDPLHIRTILESVEEANHEYGMQIRLLMEPYELGQFGLSGKEDYILVDAAEYPMELFADEEHEGEQASYDIHAGAFETAAMKYFYADLVKEQVADRLEDNSLTDKTLAMWMAGGEQTVEAAPLGYAGNPAGYKRKLDKVSEIFKMMTGYLSDKM